MPLTESRRLLFILALSLTCPIESLRILQISPGWSNSHILFNYRLAEMLTDHGHNVTVLIALVRGSDPPTSPAPQGVEEIRYYLAQSMEGLQVINAFQELSFQKPKLTNLFFVTFIFRRFAAQTADELMSDPELMERLHGHNFDMTLAHHFDIWPAGLSHRLGIPKFVAVAPGAFLMDHTYWLLSLPNNPAVVPNAMAHCSDRMTFAERVKNTIFWISAMIFVSIDRFRTGTEDWMYKKPPHHTEADSNLWKLGGDTAAVFINGEPILDFVKPLVPGIFYLGDLEQRSLKPFSQEWQNVMDASDNGLIIFSFGTLANTSRMSLELKEKFLAAFTKFPDYTIIWRLEGDMPAGLDEQKHVKIVKWMPQRELLFHPKTKLFITHGGYNSFLEAAEASMPLLLMPLFSDQYSNAKRAVQLGIGLALNKFTATSKEIEDAVRVLLTKESFRANAKKLTAQLKDYIMDNEDVAVRQIERTASGNRLWPTLKAAQRLNWIQYSSLDVIAVFVVATFIVIRILVAIVCGIFIARM